VDHSAGFLESTFRHVLKLSTTLVDECPKINGEAVRSELRTGRHDGDEQPSRREKTQRMIDMVDVGTLCKRRIHDYAVVSGRRVDRQKVGFRDAPVRSRDLFQLGDVRGQQLDAVDRFGVAERWCERTSANSTSRSTTAGGVGK
jgi:hypothetical protein